MKNRILRALVLAASVVSLASCGSKNCTPAEGTSGATTDNAKVEEKTLTKAFSSPAKVTYSNRRPTYNYYLTTFAFETLEVFSDSSYAFSRRKGRNLRFLKHYPQGKARYGFPLS